MATQQAAALWRTQLPLYNRIYDRVREAVLTPLMRFLPPDFQQMEEALREELESREMQNYEPHLKVIVEHVEGARNKSIIELADKLSAQLGGSLKFWQNVILDVGEAISYASDLTLWQVRKVFEQHLYADAEQLSSHRIFLKLAKKYMAALITLIKSIAKFDEKKDSISRIDELYKKVKSAEGKYLSYSQHCSGLQTSPTMEELSNNLSQVSKKNAIKDLFNFAEPKKSKPDKNKNTLLNYKFTLGRNPSERVEQPQQNLRVTGNGLSGERLSRFEFYFNHLKMSQINSEDLKREFESGPSRQKTCHSINLTTIWDKDFYFSYVAHPVEVPLDLDFLNPIHEYSAVNYDVCSEDEFQELLGEDIGNCSDFSSVSELSHAASFIVSDGHLSDDEINPEKNEPKLKDYGVFGAPWSFQRKQDLKQFEQKNSDFGMVAICRVDNFPLPLVLLETVEDEILMSIVDGKDRKEIQEAVQKKCALEKVKITKAKIDQFLRKKCLRVKQDATSKMVYRLMENEDKTNRDSRGKRSDITASEKIVERIEPETEEEKAPEASYIAKPRNSLAVPLEIEETRRSHKISPRVTRNRSRSRRANSQSQWA